MSGRPMNAAQAVEWVHATKRLVEIFRHARRARLDAEKLLFNGETKLRASYQAEIEAVHVARKAEHQALDALLEHVEPSGAGVATEVPW